MRRLLWALAALLLLLAPAEAKSRCGPGETALRHGGCASLRLHSPVPLPQRRLCYGGGHADSLGRCPRRFCANGMSPDASGHCRGNNLCPNGRAADALGQCNQGRLCANGEPSLGGLCSTDAGGSARRPPLTPGPPVVPLPQSNSPAITAPTIPNLTPAPPVLTPGGKL